MTQPAKVQEPSMEEILASIRRIIADDEAKPAAAEKPASPAPPRPEAPAKTVGMKDIPPSAIAPRRRSRPLPSPRRRLLRRSLPSPATIRTTSTRCSPASMRQRPRPTSGRRSPSPSRTCSNSPTRWRCRIRRRRRRSTRSSRGRHRIHRAHAAKARQPAYEPPPFESEPRRYSRSCRARPSPPSSPPSIRWPIPCSATTRGRWKIWSRKCCGRC